MNGRSITDSGDLASRGRLHFGVVCVLGIVVFLAHRGALKDGLFLDDHWHQVSLEQADWSPGSLLKSTTIQPSRFLHAWWQDKDLRWDYSRPLAMAWMKAVRQWSGGSVSVQHLSSIVWHYLCVVLVYWLCFRVTRHGWWSGVAGLLFAIYPHTAYTVGWLAAQNAILQTTLMLAALLCYIQASGLQFQARSTESSLANPRPLRFGFYGLTVAFFVGALLCRENAVVFPIVALAFDIAFGGVSHAKKRWPVHVGLFLLTFVFVIWRITVFDGHIPEVYFRQPDDWTYALWYLAKLLHYVVATIWLTPMFIGPTRYQNPWAETPGDCLLMLLILVALGVGYYFACRKYVRGYWIWPLWIFLAVWPVVPVLATPHSAYMAGVGFVLALVMKPSQAPVRKARGSIAAATWFMIASVAAFSIYRVCWRGVVRAEQYTIAQMAANPRPNAPSEIFLINLPLANIYLPLGLRESWSMSADALRCHVLTFAPHLLMGPARCRIEQVDAYSFVLSSDEKPYFAGLLGEFLTKAMRQDDRFESGQVIHGELFDVQVMQMHAGGVSAIRFTFHEPLAGERYRFYALSADCPGDPIVFWRQRPLDAPGSILVGGPCSPETACEGAPLFRQARQRLFDVLKMTARFIRTDLYLTSP